MSEAANGQRKKWPRWIKIAILCGVILVLLVIWLMVGGGIIIISDDVPTEMSFSGDSAGLKQTVVVPTLDSPVPEGNNVVWCLSFQMAWDCLVDKVIKEPIELVEGDEVAELLNNSASSAEDMLEQSYYSNAGLVKDDIIQTIQQGMAAKFPMVEPPEFAGLERSDTILAYAYLAARVKFHVPYLEFDRKLVFRDVAEEETPVKAFGLWRSNPGDEKIREQIEVLYSNVDYEKRQFRNTEFAIDLCKKTEPYQIVLACVPRRETLAATLADLQRKMQDDPLEPAERKFSEDEVLLVPEMFWKISHHFSELEGKFLKNKNYAEYWIDKALQDIQFRLDRSGVVLESHFELAVKACVVREFIFDKPFLIYLKKRGGENPFFVMWVDNAELLARPGS
ncbi:MAG: hypothetical protein JXD22_05235 [Sedimentisphaerales bacterium]|nr:hypothetical protein [Sedimentisphaerales bacterium]